MLNRRHIRIKILQTFYAYFQSDNQDMAKGEKELLHSMQRIYDLYLYLLQLFIALKRQANIQVEESKRSTFTKKEELGHKNNFAENQIISFLENSSTLEKFCKDRKISWEGDLENDLAKKII
jgi:N utilization substance protein B